MESAARGAFPPPPPFEDDTCLSVSELTDRVKGRLEDFPPVQVRGELSNFTSAYASGHWYFTLKDTASQIRGVMFKSSNEQVSSFTPSDGMEVKVQGRLNVYKPRGEYNIICRTMELCGQGGLQEQFEQLKQKLKTEGLFDRRRKLPFLPRHIAIISSPRGAAIRDILNILKRRFKGVRVTLIGTLVQGAKAGEDLRQAVRQAERLKDVDVLIVTRGGGSLEDLWCFNDEGLARALFRFPRPVISAVGHEIDFTICDFVADLRAPTPSAAAELVVQNAAQLQALTRQLHDGLKYSIFRKIKSLKDQLRSLSQGLTHPAGKLSDLVQYIDELSQRMKQALLHKTKTRRQALSHQQALLESLNPLQVLDRGYALVSQNRRLVRQARDLNLKDRLHIRFAKGEAFASPLKKITSHQKGGDSGV